MRAEFIDPGSLRTELALEQAELTPDGAGGHIENWVEIASVFARVQPQGSTAAFGAGQTIETVTHRITMRFRDDLRSGMRLRRGDRVFEIITLHDPDETGRYLVCRAREEGR
jgi:SPP1 family predicted phage head-tail adaptor